MQAARPGNRHPGFTEGPVHLLLIKLSAFMFMGFSAMIIASLIEIYYIGLLGTAELAAISFTFPVVMTMNSLSMGLSVGASSIIARSAGAGDHYKVQKLVSHCLVLVVLATSVLALVGYHLSETIFRLLGAKTHILELTVAYTSIWFYGLPFFALSMVSTGLIRATGNAVVPGIILTAGSVLQVILSPMLIFGVGPFPELGFIGAAWGFVLSRIISFLFSFYVIGINEKLLITSMDNLFASWRAILHVGIPAAATNLIMPVSMGIGTRLLAGHGAAVVAGYGVGSRVDSLLAMVMFAVASSTGPFIGQNWGARKFDRVKKALSLANRFCLSWGLFAFIFMLLFGRWLVGFFADDAEVIETARIYLLIIPLSIGFMGTIAVAGSSFNALGKPMPPLIISLLRMLILYIPLALLGDHLFGYRGVFMATAISTVLLGIVSWHWNRQVINREIRKNRRDTLPGSLADTI
jgi:putative MATE family efflux protein